MASERLNERRGRVLSYLRNAGGATARDVAREVFGGTGGTRTSPRARAYTDLLHLERSGQVARSRPDGNADVWRALTDTKGAP
jgi:hypothetical protein